MSLLQKVTTAPHICKISFDFSGELTPVSKALAQNFYNSYYNIYSWKEAHFGKRKASFKETEKITDSGSEYTQVLKIIFPSVDKFRSDRLALFKEAKYVRLELSNGLMLVMGRNDFFQNKRTEFKTASTQKSTTLTVTTKSIFSIGFLEENNLGSSSSVSEFIDFLIPLDTPINLINI